MATEKYHLGERISQVLEDRGMTKAEFARRIYTSRQNVNTLLRREDISVWQLMHIGKVLGFNFFTELTTEPSQKSAIPPLDTSQKSPSEQTEFIALFHRPGHIRMTKAIQCLENLFGPESSNWNGSAPPLVFQGVYHLMVKHETGGET